MTENEKSNNGYLDTRLWEYLRTDLVSYNKIPSIG